MRACDCLRHCTPSQSGTSDTVGGTLLSLGRGDVGSRSQTRRGFVVAGAKSTRPRQFGTGYKKSSFVAKSFDMAFHICNLEAKGRGVSNPLLRDFTMFEMRDRH